MFLRGGQFVIQVLVVIEQWITKGRIGSSETDLRGTYFKFHSAGDGEVLGFLQEFRRSEISVLRTEFTGQIYFKTSRSLTYVDDLPASVVQPIFSRLSPR